MKTHLFSGFHLVVLSAWLGLSWQFLGLGAAEGNHRFPAATSYSGTFKDEKVTIELSPLPGAPDSNRYRGSIRLEDQVFPVSATLQNGMLKGTFESQGDRFDFTASLEGQMLTFTTEGTTYKLRKQSINPLARPVSPNPLHQPSEGVSTDTGTPAASTGTVWFVRHNIKDDDRMIGGDAFQMLIPAGWKVEGGVRWRLHPALPACLALRVTSPSGSEALEVLPTLPFVWTVGGIPFFPTGSTYLGNEVREPTEDPMDFIKRYLIPRFRPNLAQAKITKKEDLPQVAEAIAATSQEPGIQKTFKAIRIRFEYPHQGKTVQEEMYCVLVIAQAPTINTTFWGTERNYSFRAEKGKLDEQAKVFQTMVASLKPSLPWFNRYLQLVQILVQNQLEQTRQVGELSRYIARTNDEINNIRRQAYENAQASHDRISAKFSQYIRGLEEYHNPVENRLVELPSGYRQAWTNPLGEYIVSDDPDFNPNIGSNSSWQRIEKKN